MAKATVINHWLYFKTNHFELPEQVYVLKATQRHRVNMADMLQTAVLIIDCSESVQIWPYIGAKMNVGC